MRVSVEAQSLRFIALSVVGSGMSTRERQLQQQSRDLKQQQAKQERPLSAFLSAYGGDDAEEAKEETTKEELEKEAEKRTRSDTLPMKDLENMIKRGGTGTMRDRKNRLEKLDLKPVAFEVPTAPNDAPRKGEGERKAPEGQENKDRRRSSTMKQFKRGSHDDSGFSVYSESEKKKSTSDEYSTSSDESIDGNNSREIFQQSLTGNSRYSRTNIDRNLPRETESSRKQENRKSPTKEEKPRRPLSSFTNPNYEEWDRHDGPAEKRHIAPVCRDADFVSRKSEKERPNRASRSFDDERRDAKGIREGIHSPEYGNTSLQDEIMSKRASLKKSHSSKSFERDSREFKGYKSENDISERNYGEIGNEKGSRERVPSLHEEILSRRASLKKSHSPIDYERDYREIHGYKSENDISDRHSREKEHTRRERRSVEGETNAPRNLKRCSQNASSLKQNRNRLESEEEVFSSDFSPDHKSRSSDQNTDGLRKRSPRSKSHDRGSDHPGHSKNRNRRSHDRVSDHSNHSRSDNSQRHSYSGNEWDLDVDDYSERVPPVIRNRNDDYDDEYRRLVKDLTRGRSRTSYEDGGRVGDNRGNKRRSKSQRGL